MMATAFLRSGNRKTGMLLRLGATIALILGICCASTEEILSTFGIKWNIIPIFT